MPSGSVVARSATNHWNSGIVSGLLIADAAAFCVCIFDTFRYASKGLSLQSAFLMLQESPMGNSFWLGLAVLAFLVFALPMAVALISTVLSQHDHWPAYLGIRARGLLPAHLLLSAVIAVFTVAAVTMQSLSGWTKDGETWRYSFVSVWLSFVLLGQPAYVFYGSPIIKKFLVRAAAKPKGATVQEIAKETAKEVLTEEGFERHVG